LSLTTNRRFSAWPIALAVAFALLLLPALAGAHGRGGPSHGPRGGHPGPIHPGHDQPSHGHPGHGHGHGGPPGFPGGGHGRGHSVDVMTRNLYLGADLAPAIGAPSLEAFVAATGQILREVSANDFPTRAKGLAQEILEKKPDLVGLQEVALWRTGPPSLAPVLSGEPSATTVRYDYLQLLLDQLNKGKQQYEVVVTQNEFDLEAPGDENGVPGDGPAAQGIPNAEINGRLTMRDVILARRGAGVDTANPQSGNFKTLLAVPILGKPLTIKRGWTATDARVRGSGWFRFVNTHLEAFDPAALVPSIRSLQAGELVAPEGPATSSLPVVLVGDLNSDDDTVEPGDQQAYRTLLEAGMVERSTSTPLGCCLRSSLLAEGAGGSVADFDHQVDHVMTRDPAEIALDSSAVTGLLPVNGFWDSDHAGLFSSLRFAH
jgi:endonuclease/exonuclease/phosphatase family metal-dependent hydrolase